MAGRRDAYTVAKNTTAKLKEAIDETGIGWDNALAIAGFAVALTTAIVFPPASVGAAWFASATLTITGATAASGIIKAGDITINGDTMLDIIASMFSELKRIRGHIEDQDQQISDAIEETMAELEEKIRDKGDGDTDVGQCCKIYPERPTLIDDHSRSDIGY